MKYSSFSLCMLVLVLVVLLTSCDASKQYGDRNKRLNDSRVENSNVPGKSRSTRDSDIGKRERSNTSRKERIASNSKTKDENEDSMADSSFRNQITQSAKKYEGIPYKYAGKSPGSGFDCSGFVSYVYDENGLVVKGTAQEIGRGGKNKNWKDLEKGDLLFFGKGKSISHVGIVYSHLNGEVKMIHSSSSRGIVVESISQSAYWRPRFQFGRDFIQDPL